MGLMVIVNPDVASTIILFDYYAIVLEESSFSTGITMSSWGLSPFCHCLIFKKGGGQYYIDRVVPIQIKMLLNHFAIQKCWNMSLFHQVRYRFHLHFRL